MAKNDMSVFEKPEYKGLLEQEQDQDEQTSKQHKKTKAKSAPGRPTKKEDEKKTKFVKVYLTPNEMKNLEKKATIGGFKISTAQVVRTLLEDNGYI